MHCGQNVSWKLLEIISADLLDTVYTVTVPSTSNPGCDEILSTNYFCIGPTEFIENFDEVAAYSTLEFTKDTLSREKKTSC